MSLLLLEFEVLEFEVDDNLPRPPPPDFFLLLPPRPPLPPLLAMADKVVHEVMDDVVEAESAGT